jgi:hypothetical protein
MTNLVTIQPGCPAREHILGGLYPAQGLGGPGAMRVAEAVAAVNLYGQLPEMYGGRQNRSRSENS